MLKKYVNCLSYELRNHKDEDIRKSYKIDTQVFFMSAGILFEFSMLGINISLCVNGTL